MSRDGFDRHRLGQGFAGCHHDRVAVRRAVAAPGDRGRVRSARGRRRRPAAGRRRRCDRPRSRAAQPGCRRAQAAASRTGARTHPADLRRSRRPCGCADAGAVGRSRPAVGPARPDLRRHSRLRRHRRCWTTGRGDAAERHAAVRDRSGHGVRQPAEQRRPPARAHPRPAAVVASRVDERDPDPHRRRRRSQAAAGRARDRRGDAPGRRVGGRRLSPRRRPQGSRLLRRGELRPSRPDRPLVKSALPVVARLAADTQPFFIEPSMQPVEPGETSQWPGWQAQQQQPPPGVPTGGGEHR